MGDFHCDATLKWVHFMILSWHLFVKYFSAIFCFGIGPAKKKNMHEMY